MLVSVPRRNFQDRMLGREARLRPAVLHIFSSAESVDTSDNNPPPPALPPRRPLRPSNDGAAAAVVVLRCGDAPRRPASTATTVNTAATAATTTTTAPPPTTTTTTPTTTTPTAISRTTTRTTTPLTAATLPTSHGSTTSPQPPLLTPPQYPAPPRPPSRTGGDEARVARARGSGRGALPSPILANGTPSSRVPPPRAGWAVRITEATLTPTSSQRPSVPGTSPTAVEQWASERAAPVWTGRAAAAVSSLSSPSLSAAAGATVSNTPGGLTFIATADREVRGPASTAGIRLEHRREEREELEATKKVEHRQQQQQQQQQCHQDHWHQQHQQRHPETTHSLATAAGRLELRGRPMSRNDAIPPLTRHPSSRASNAAGGGFTTTTTTVGSNGDDCGTGEDAADHHSRPVFDEECVHDHSRPFPPPRLPSVSPPPPPPPQSNVTTTASVPGVPTSRLAPLTMPLTPLSSSFRSRPALRRPQNVETSSDANSRSLLALPADAAATTTATTTTTTTTTSSSSSSARSTLGEVSLATPRPSGERTNNEYVEAPFKHSCCNQERRLDANNKAVGDCPKIERRHHHHHHHRHFRGHEGGTDTALVPTHRTRGRARNHHQGLRGFNGGASTGVSSIATSATTTTTTATGTAVTKQPVSFTKEPANTLGSRTPYDPASLSIICDFCDKCRCESCRQPPPLPSKWLCDNTCLCSAETVLDYASCLCCVKGLFYHCVDGGSGGGVASGVDGEVGASCSDEPCSCTGHRRVSRWACLGALTLIMPCLLCYWPFKGCVTLCEACYARYAAQGCRCNPNAIGSAGGRHHPTAGDIRDSRDPEKRLLDPVTPEL
ncbi:protein sprouty [Odontomachus brunneus]|uniref:protein sprouty n=1 Tax=Odontomachus brunneus TaxID=486640 RepID=UPI0013F2628F|nr:protein sprouty [Odontomachus brunneus]